MEHQQQRYVGEILVRHGALEQDRMRELLVTAEERDASLLDLILLTRETEEKLVVEALAKEVGIPFVDDLDPASIPTELIERVPITFARPQGVLPLSDEGDRVRVALANPLDPAPLDDLRALLGKPIDPVAATSEAIEDAINQVYQRADESGLGDGSEEEEDELQDLLDMTDEAPVIRWVNNLFFNAAKVNASDIHIEPGDKEVAVRYRIDGKLKREKAAPKSALNSIVSRVKIEAGLNIAEKRLPQDGRITKKIQGRLVDVRVSVVPTAKGERIVMRLLDKERTILDLSDLGYEGGRLELVQHLIERPNGILLVTGPTGSGKTTTLYAGLSYINSPDRNILTAEDPVEYELPGIGQMQVHPKIGLTFASGLRSFLRQDPDVIMVGEIRDHETAEIAIHASLTGHLVLSTLHTNDAAGAMTRMVEMGVQPFLIASSVLGVIAQRLVRKLCRHCRVPHPVTAEDLRSLGLDASRAHVITGSGVQPFRGMASMMESEVGDLLEETASPEHDRAPHGLAFGGGNGRISAYPDPAGGRTSSLPPPPPPVDGAELLAAFGLGPRSVVYKPAEGGCEACGGVGYKGRISIAEVLVLDEPVRRDILNQADAGTIARTATLRGMRTLREDGARLVLAGVTSLEEVLAATQAGEMED